MERPDYMPDYCNPVFLRGLNDGGAGDNMDPDFSEDANYRRGWNEGREQYDEFMKHHGFVGKAIAAGLIAVSAGTVIWAIAYAVHRWWPA